MNEHTLRVLEFPKVLNLLASQTSFSVSRELAKSLEPEQEFEAVKRLQWETAEMVALEQMGLDLPMGGAADVRPVVDAAQKGVVLEPSDLKAVGQTVLTAFRARQLLERLMEQVPRLADIGGLIADFRPEVARVEDSITPQGQLDDNASPVLASTRRELRSARDRLEQQAQAALADAIRRGIAQDGVLTERGGRKVIGIKADFRGAMSGIVHDVSSSGATVFVEPMGVVDAGNDARELELAERREVQRILRELTELFAKRHDEAVDAVNVLARLDLIGAKMRLGKRLGAQLPPPNDGESWLRPAGGTTDIIRGRHPLLGPDVVPMDLDIGGEFPGVIITGPNTGGKTVALKTIGLLTMMVQSGIPPSCDGGSRFAIFSQIEADIGDEQSLEQSLSTFSSHMRNMKEILAAAQPGTLVLLDELGAGTDPTEGAALSQAILEELLERGASIVATTHHGELKMFAHEESRLRNASVEFDLETLSPTYRLTVGLPGQSNALAIASRLGIDDAVIRRAEQGVATGHVEMERLLEDIRNERVTAEEERVTERTAREESEEIRRALARRREEIERERTELLDAARREAEELVSRARRELDRAEKKRQQYDPSEAAERLESIDAEIERIRKETHPKRRAAPAPELRKTVGIGDRVHVRDFGEPGEALSEVGEDGRVEVQFGALRMKVSVDRIDRIEAGMPAAAVRQSQGGSMPGAAGISNELDLRGERAQEAVERCESYLDSAFRDGLPYVRIIHGKGTGALRLAIRDALRSHPLVTEYHTAPQNEGGDGATIATLAGA